MPVKKNINKVLLPNRFKPDDLKIGIIHIGLGAFHRAHQVFYINKLLNTADTDALNWGYLSSTIRSNVDLINTLENQKNKFTLVERDVNGETYSQIEAIKTVLFAGNGESKKLIAELIKPDVKIITYTVTEKGYYFDVNEHKLILSDKDIKHDLKNFDTPKTAIGITAKALHLRYEKKLEPLTLLSCDNMPANGKVLKQAIIDFATEIDKPFAEWVEKNCKFPCSMIDRIVPAVTADLITHLKSKGIEDQAPVATERFSQWVIEDNFVKGQRPKLEKVDVQFVDDVEPFELMKLKMLNGSHSLIAYLGALAGFKTVDTAIANPAIFKLIKYYMLNVAAPYVYDLPKSISLEDYAEQLLKRFANPSLKHRTEQIAMDGSKKIPQRWLSTLSSQLRAAKPYHIIAFGLASWILYGQGKDEKNQPLEVSDPLEAQFKEIHSKYGNAQQLVEHYFDLSEVFPKILANDQNVKASVAHFITRLKTDGVLKTIDTLNLE
jgi:fructuronate reductase